MEIVAIFSSPGYIVNVFEKLIDEDLIPEEAIDLEGQKTTNVQNWYVELLR